MVPAVPTEAVKLRPEFLHSLHYVIPAKAYTAKTILIFCGSVSVAEYELDDLHRKPMDGWRDWRQGLLVLSEYFRDPGGNTAKSTVCIVLHTEVDIAERVKERAIWLTVVENAVTGCGL